MSSKPVSAPYVTSDGVYVDAATLNLNPTGGTTIAAAGTSYSAVYELGRFKNVVATLNVVSVSTDDTLDVTIESSDDMTTWYTVAAFTQYEDDADDDTEIKGCTAVGKFLRAKYVAAGSSVAVVCSCSAAVR